MWRVKASISNSLSARCTSTCPLRHTCTREENTGSDERKTNTRLSSEKESVFPPKQRRIERKSTPFLTHLVHPTFSPHFLSIKLFSFERKLLSLHLTKHNPPFFSPHCGVYIAQTDGLSPMKRRKRSLAYWRTAGAHRNGHLGCIYRPQTGTPFHKVCNIGCLLSFPPHCAPSVPKEIRIFAPNRIYASPPFAGSPRLSFKPTPHTT